MSTKRFYGTGNRVNVEFYKDKASEHRWRLRASNQEVVCASSEGFHSQQGAFNNYKLTLKIMADIADASDLP